MGVLYLEHASLPQAFTEERTYVLGMLSSQLAISFENANLYESLKRNQEELEEKNRQLSHTDKIKDQFMANMVCFLNIHLSVEEMIDWLYIYINIFHSIEPRNQNAFEWNHGNE